MADHVTIEHESRIATFVTLAVSDSAGSTLYSESDLHLAATRLSLWAWQTAGLELDRALVFRRETIARFIAVGCPTLKPSVRGNLRSQLLRMSEVLLDRALAPRRMQPLPPSDPVAPYSADEISMLACWAATQTTTGRRENAATLLALGMGAGLAAREIGELRVAEIDVDPEGVQVRVTGARSRTVPVLADWAEPLAERRACLAPELYAFRENHTAFYPNLVSNFVSRSRLVGPRPQTQRMRSTWILHHLNAGTPVVPLMRAAGVESLEAFTRYVRFTQDIDDSEARRLLRGTANRS